MRQAAKLITFFKVGAKKRNLLYFRDELGAEGDECTLASSLSHGGLQGAGDEFV